jgi:hypothetical protein
MAAGRTLTVSLVANTNSFKRGMMSAARDAQGFQGKMTAIGASLRGMVGPAMLGAAAAAGAFATKLAVDGVKAAMEEQKALAQLTTALDNVGQGFADAQVGQFIDDLQYTTAVADSELRPAFVRLVTATRDVAQAQDLMNLAMDVSAGTGRSLESVSLALAKAATGQTTALRRLGVPLDAATLKSGDLNAITEELARTFGGQASAAANTMQGRLKVLQIGAEELQEAFGTGVITAFSGSSDSAQGLTQSLRDLQDEAENLGSQVGSSLGVFLDIAEGFGTARQAAEEFIDSMGVVGDVVGLVGYMFGNPLGFAVDRVKILSASLTGNDAALAAAMGATGESADAAAPEIETFGYQAGAAADEVEDLTAAVSELETYITRTNSVIKYEAAWDELRNTLEENGNAFDYSSEKGRENNSALLGFAQATADAAAAQDTMFGKVAYTQDALANMSKVLNNTKMSPATKAALLEPFQALINDLDLSQQDAANLQAQLDRLRGKTINIDVKTRYYGTPPPGGYTTNEAMGGYIPGYAMGSHLSDSIPAMLSRGEYVVRASSVAKLGLGFMDAVNMGRVPSGAGGSGVTIGTLNVTSAPGERAEESVPRSLRRLAFVAGLSV